MAKSLDINSSSYAGELALPYIAPAILAADTIANGYVTVHENVKFKAVLKKLSNANEIIDAYGCDFSANAGDLDLDEVVLTPTELKVNQELCKGDFRSDWEAMATGRTLMGDRLPPNFEAFLLQFLAGKVSEGIENAIWQGNFNSATGATSGGPAPFFDGIWHLIQDGVGSVNNAENFAAAGLTAANILERVDAVVAGGSSAVLNSADSKIFMSRKSLYLFQRALGGTITTSGAAPTQGGILTGAVPMSYMGYEIIAPAGFPNDCVLFTSIANLHFGCNLATDQIEATVVDMTLTDASDNVRVAMRFSGGVQVGNLGDLSVGYIQP
tara:strand:+ start:135 stop:1112 length:978 start_codon:yes stop_codon:yes gene_type:complete